MILAPKALLSCLRLLSRPVARITTDTPTHTPTDTRTQRRGKYNVSKRTIDEKHKSLMDLSSRIPKSHLLVIEGPDAHHGLIVR